MGALLCGIIFLEKYREQTFGMCKSASIGLWELDLQGNPTFPEFGHTTKSQNFILFYKLLF